MTVASLSFGWRNWLGKGNLEFSAILFDVVGVHGS